MKRNYFWIGLIGVGLFASCGGNEKKANTKTSDSTAKTSQVVPAPTVSQPFSSVNIAFKSFEVDASKAQKIELSQEAELSIPADAFVDENQQPIKGNVKLEYRQFNTLAEIIASGITMNYDSAGIKLNFETAGMFELKGSCYGKSVSIKPDKQLEIKMKSKMQGDFNFYKLDDKAGWKYQNTTRNFKEDLKKDDSESLISSHQKVSNKISNLTQPVKFDTNKDIALQIIPTKTTSKIQSLKGVMWKYIGDKDPKEIALLFKKKWTSTEIKLADKEKKTFEVTLTKDETTEKVLVTPALIGKRYEEAMKIYENAKKEAEKQKVEQEKKDKLAASDELMCRTATINGFGIYNYDRYHLNTQLTVKSDFVLDKKGQEEILLVYLVSPKENVVIRFTKDTFDKFNFNPSVENKVVAILPNNKVAILTTKEFAQILPKLQKKESFTFVLKEHSKSINNLQDLEQLLGSI